MDAHYLYKAAFAFYLEANDLNRNPIRPPDPIAMNLLIRKLNFRSVVLHIVEAANLEDPRYDMFVKNMKRIETLYHSIGPEHFHPAFSRVMFGPYTRRTWEYLHQDGDRSVPDETGVKIMRLVSWDLNELLNSNKLFKDNNLPKEKEGYIGNEGYEEEGNP